MRLVQELSEDGFDRQLELCELMMRIIDSNTVRLNNTAFSDKATFKLNGWADVNPHWMRKQHTQHPDHFKFGFTS